METAAAFLRRRSSGGGVAGTVSPDVAWRARHGESFCGGFAPGAVSACCQTPLDASDLDLRYRGNVADAGGGLGNSLGACACAGYPPDGKREFLVGAEAS